jgi:hypothetical protein
MPIQLPTQPNYSAAVPAPVSPLEQYGKILQMKALNGQIAMQPMQEEAARQDVQARTLQNEKAQNELKSQQAMVKAWSDPDFLKGFTGTPTADSSGLGFDPNALTTSLVKQGVLPEHAMAMAQQFIERSQKIATTLKDQAQTGEANATIREKGFKQLADRIAGVLDSPVSKAGDALTQLKQDLLKNKEAFAGVPQEDLAHVFAADLEHLPAMATLIGLDGKIADYHKSKAEAAIAQQKVIPDNGKLSPDTQQQVDKDVAVATNPQIQAGKIAVATAEGTARAAVEAKTARGSNAALAKVPPHLVAPASAAADKAGQDYAQAKSVSDRLAAMMKAAKAGNVVSYQLIPEEGALQLTTSQGVHRINMAEIQNYGGGSLWQKMVGHIGKALTGQSIPGDVLKDMEQMQEIQAEGSRTKYENTLSTINQTYGAEFKPVEMKTMEAKPKPVQPAGATHTGRSSLDHKLYYLDANNKKLGLAE